MIFPHLNGQISASIETYPYCFMGEELTAVKFSEKTNIFPLLTPLLTKIKLTDGQTPPDFLTCPLFIDNSLHDYFNCLPPAPEHLKVAYDMLSPYSKE